MVWDRKQDRHKRFDLEQREKVLRLLFAKLNGLKSERYAFYISAVTEICKACFHYLTPSSSIVLTCE